jgi:predicted nucleotidyltransferase
VDFVNPVEAVIPGAQGRILAALARTTAEVNLRTVADLAGVSPAQATRVLPTLIALGLVERREAPPSALFRLVRENLAAQPIVELANLSRTCLGELAKEADRLIPLAVNVTVFGSFARGQARTDSDIDVLVVRGAAIDDDDERFLDRLGMFTDRIGELTGNPVNLVEVGESEVPALLKSRRPLWRDVISDGVLLSGLPLSSLKEGARA